MTDVSPHLQKTRRRATSQELDTIPWLRLLSAADQQRTRAEIEVGTVEAKEYVCREGRPVRYWMGLIDGLLKVGHVRGDGSRVTYMGIAPGSWFGEGTALKHENYRYSIYALRRSTIAVLPLAHFHWLLNHSIEFNKVLISQLNERVGQFIAGRESDRASSPEIRVARTLVALFNPILAPSLGDTLRITQQELADIVGLSRQRVNEALASFVDAGIVEVAYGGLRVLNMHDLQQFGR